MKRLIQSAVFLLFSTFWLTLFAQDPFYFNHPELEWSSYETEHFVVHFHQGTQRTANIVGKIAEDIYQPVTRLYAYQPSGKIHFVIKDTDDYSNGAAYFFDNKIEIWAENLDYVMRGTRNWLRDVVTHEFSHMISIQKMIKFSRTVPYGFLQIFGYESERRKDVVRGFPNTLVSYPISSINIPVWFAEGVAQFQAPGSHFDYRDPHREMILRDRIINDQLLTYDEMGVFGKNGHGNESAYNQGYAFVEYLCDRFGDEIITQITHLNAKLSSLTFDQSLLESTGIPADSLYLQWKQYLSTNYQKKLSTIVQNKVEGVPIEREGFANLFPVWSPQGKKIAYISNKGNDYFGQNKLILFNRQSGEKKVLTSSVSSSISWSPNGKYIAYSCKTLEVKTGSYYNDLYVYNLETDREIRITKQMRAKNPDWNSDGNKIVFVSETNGLNQLFLLEIEDLTSNRWYPYPIDIETGNLNSDITKASYVRNTQVRGGKLKQLLAFADGRQIYHPRWAPDDQKIIFDTAIDYGRDIGWYQFDSNSFELIITGKQELRYPIFHPQENSIYYASSETGIYNLYKQDLDTGKKLLLTNVTGGALMPDINEQNELVYACYENLGFHIYTITNQISLDPQNAKYEENYLASIPEKNFDDSKVPEVPSNLYKQSFTGVHILPRLLIDYRTVKPGIYVWSNDVLDKMSFIAGADVNFNFDYDLYGIFEYREFLPTLFLEAYNFNSNITDTLGIRTGKNTEIIDQDITFNLTEIQAGLSMNFSDRLQARLAGVISLYDAKLKWLDPFANDLFTFRYRYLNGRAVHLSFALDQIKRDRFREINPSGGKYVFFRYSYENNEFLTDFDTGKNIGLEVYKRYEYHKIELDWEQFFSNPIAKNHSFSIRLRSGYIDRPVDDFFHLFAGGLVGLKGYSYFSIEGTKKLLTTLTYRFPLVNHLDWQLFNIYFDKLYFAVFYDYGNAWVDDSLDLKEFKRDVGFQIRLETFSNYLFPTRIFAEAVYPLDEVNNNKVIYKKDWRFYFGVLFDFDIRERIGKTFAYLKRPGIF